ncbi:MAG: ribosome maturation factor RimM [Alphaproteobacteria bacterium]
MSDQILVGQIVSVHGVKGAVKVKPYLTDGTILAKLNPLTDKNGRIFELVGAHKHGETLIAFIKGITNRTTAESLRGISLYADRCKFPQTQEDEFYYCDLVGLTVLRAGEPFGVVTAVNNYGAGDILEIKQKDGKVMDFAFTDAVFPQVDKQNKTIEIVLPRDVNGDVDED